MTKNEIVAELSAYGVEATTRARKSTLEALLASEKMKAVTKPKMKTSGAQWFIAATAGILLGTMVAANADDMMMDGLQDRNNINLNYVDAGETYVTATEDLSIDGFDSDGASLSLDGRNGPIEYGISVNEDALESINVGLAIPLKSGFGAVVGVEVNDDGITDDDQYYGAIYESGPVELRATYQDEADDFKVSGRYYFNETWGVNAGVQFDDSIDEDSAYTVGVTYKF